MRTQAPLDALLGATRQKVLAETFRQPERWWYLHELARTLSWGYVNMNASGFVTLARLGESAGVDLWNYQTKDGRSVRKALEWIVPYASGEKEWTHKQIKPRAFDLTIPLLEITAAKYKRSEYSTIAARLRKSGDKESFRYLGID